LAAFVNVSFEVNKVLFNKSGKVVMGCALATTPFAGIAVIFKNPE